MKTLRAVDLFCGAGGTSTGLIQACADLGRKLDLLAVNHWPTAVETHTANHPDARHLCESLDSIDPRKACKRLDLLMASPECVHHSIARGGKPCSDQSRASAWHVVRWAEALQPRCILVENVREFATWGPLNDKGRPIKSRKGETFEAWLSAIRSLGYAVSHRVCNAADYGAATSRERLFIMARRGRAPLTWPEPTHARHATEDLFGSLPKWRAAREIIDWSIQGQSIFNRKRPLKPKTLERIWAGLRKFGGAAFAMHTTHQGGERVSDLEEPLPTVTGANRGEQALVTPNLVREDADGKLHLLDPFLVPFFGERDGQEPRCHSVDAPLPTVTGHGAGGLVQPLIVQFKGTGDDQIPSTAQSLDGPLGTITAQGGNFALCEPFVMSAGGCEVGPRSVDDPLNTVLTRDHMALIQPFLMQMSQSGSNGDRLRPDSSPLPTITTADDLALVQPFLVTYYGKGGPRPLSEPLDTVTTRDRFALVTIHGQPALLDIRFRMLQPHELAAAMSFPPEYWFAGNRGDIVRQVGNAVDVKQAKALLKCLLAA